MAAIDCNVPVDLDLTAMRTGAPDVEALRALFTELEFTSLLKELLPLVEVTQAHYTEAKSASDVETVLKNVSASHALAVAVAAETASALDDQEEESDEPQESMLPLTAAPTEAAPAQAVAISAAAGTALTIFLQRDSLPLEQTGARLKSALEREDVAKAIYDYKAAIHAFAPQGITLRGVRHDPMLYSYLLDPTYSSHRLPEVALRRFNLKLSGTLAESADVTGRFAASLRHEVEQAKLVKLYEEIDLPLVPVLAGMEQAGVKIDREVLKEMSSRLEREVEAKAREIYQLSGSEFNINSPKQLGDVLFNKMNLPKPVKYGKGKTISTAVDVLEGLAETHDVARLVLEYRQLSKLKSTYVDALPALLNPASGRLHTTFGQTGTATGRLSSANPNLQNIPIRTELGREIRAAFTAEAGPRAAGRGLFPDRTCACWPTSPKTRCWSRPTAVATTFTPSPPRKSSACRR